MAAGTAAVMTTRASARTARSRLLIAVIALFLAFCETMGKSAQTARHQLNIKASDTWNFFQAKTVRQTSLRTAAEAMTLQLPTAPNEQARAAMAEQIDKWKATVARYDSDPKEQDGRKELRALAEKYEHERDVAMARYHNYEFGSAAFQIGIVLARRRSSPARWHLLLDRSD